MSGVFTPKGKSVMLDALTGMTASIHTADPTNTGGVAELSGGGYARKSIVYGAAANGNRNATTLPEFDIPAGTSISHFAIWQGTDCIAKGPLSAIESFTGAGKYRLTDADLNLNDPV